MTRKPSPFYYVIRQNGEILRSLYGVTLEFRGDLVGTVGNVPCFAGMRFIEKSYSRLSWDRTSAHYGGPVTIEIVSVETGERCGLIGLATPAEVMAHSRGQLVEG